MIDLQGENHLSPNKYGIKNNLMFMFRFPLLRGGNLNKEKEE